MRRLPTDPVLPDESEAPTRGCDHPGCTAGGDFGAPRSRLDLNRYYWFCLEHVRAYNSACNYWAAAKSSPTTRPRDTAGGFFTG